jgi:hypothetical protein
MPLPTLLPRRRKKELCVDGTCSGKGSLVTRLTRLTRLNYNLKGVVVFESNTDVNSAFLLFKKGGILAQLQLDYNTVFSQR